MKQEIGGKFANKKLIVTVSLTESFKLDDSEGEVNGDHHFHRDNNYFKVEIGVYWLGTQRTTVNSMEIVVLAVVVRPSRRHH